MANLMITSDCILSTSSTPGIACIYYMAIHPGIKDTKHILANLIWIMESSVTHSHIFNYIFLVIWELSSFNLVD